VSRLDAEIAELLAVRAAAVALLEAVEAQAECIDGVAGNPCDDCQAAVAAAAKKLREAMK
jgi:hypothetical protein